MLRKASRLNQYYAKKKVIRILRLVTEDAGVANAISMSLLNKGLAKELASQLKELAKNWSPAALIATKAIAIKN
jgi:uncharacterized membrane protein (Fun14 family)